MSLISHISVNSREEAFAIAGCFFKCGIAKDNFRSERAGYPIYMSNDSYEWVSDLGSRLEVNLSGRTVNVWVS